MAILIRPYRRGGFEVDIRLRLPSGDPYRERRKSPCSTRALTHRWAEAREREIVIHGPQVPAGPVPTLAAFAPTYLADAAENRQKPSAVQAKRSILAAHLLPLVGDKRLDEMTAEDVAALKTRLKDHAAKTLNNALSCWHGVYTTAIKLGILTAAPCPIPLVPVHETSRSFYDFPEYARLLEAAEALGSATYVALLLGGDAGLRCGEILALEWGDVSLAERRLVVARAEWRGHLGATKGGKIRHIPLTQRLARALADHHHLKSPRVACQDDGRPLTHKVVYQMVKRAATRAGLAQWGVHLLRHTFCSHLAMKGAPARAIQELAGHMNLTTTQRYMHLSPAATDRAIRLLEGDRLEALTGTTGKV